MNQQIKLFPTPRKDMWTFQHNNKLYMLIAFEAPRGDSKPYEEKGA